MEAKAVITPCISICRTDPVSGFCYGCGRSDEDKKMWSDSETSNQWKLENLKIIRDRLSGWQQAAFDLSYKNKKETGLSLIKKKQLNQINKN